MLIEKRNSTEIATFSHIDTPPEAPIQTKEWVFVAVGVTAVALLVAPVWAALGLICIGPAILLKKYSYSFSEKNQKCIDQIYVAATEIFLLIKMGIHYLSGHPKPQQRVKKGGQPILLVHGYLNNDSVWSHYQEALPQKGFGPVYTIDLGHPFLPLSEYAQKVAAKAKEIREETQNDKLILIGHSMGGVVSSLYATKLALEGSVTDVFTLGSPLNGAPMADVAGMGPNGREMRPGSPLLAEIRKGIEAKKGSIRFYHVGSDADTLVPADSALAGSGIKFRVTDLGHTHLLTSKKISDWVCDQLQKVICN